MSTFERSERLAAQLPDLLVEIAAPRVPDYTDDVLAVTAAIRQRPRWTFPERWLPMIIANRRLALPAIPWRFVTALLAILAIVAATLLIAGSRPHLPPPFGPARNGAIAFDQNGDIYVRDTLEGEARLVVGGGSDDFAASFTRDGRHLTFLRRTAGREGSPDERIDGFIANVDGSNAVDATGPLIAPNWMDLSPDDSTLVVHAAASAQPSILTDDQRSRLYLVDLRHPSAPKPIPIALASETVPSFRGPDGAEIVFRGRQLMGQAIKSGIFAVHPDGSGLRALTPVDGDPENAYQQPLLSPDGRQVTYTVWTDGPQQLVIHVLDLTTGVDRMVTTSGYSEGYATFSPDGSQIVYIRYSGSTQQAMVSTLGAGARPVTAGPAYVQRDGTYVASSFSPDGKWIVVNDIASKETRLVDATTGGNGRVIPWSANGFGWQRLAP
jgi:Tol biopolymer transport system component